MASTSILGILLPVSSSSTFPTWHLQLCMDNLLDNDLAGNVLWKEMDLPAITPSIMDHLILISSFNVLDIEKIIYNSETDAEAEAVARYCV
ncbi:hypothetical protein BDR04DRAFT_1156419 [Suillus decipiens]|nr:hypothetical protein BDR04DRAFT_1156419 [Suillus decipiens]